MPAVAVEEAQGCDPIARMATVACCGIGLRLTQKPLPRAWPWSPLHYVPGIATGTLFAVNEAALG